MRRPYPNKRPHPSTTLRERKGGAGSGGEDMQGAALFLGLMRQNHCRGAAALRPCIPRWLSGRGKAQGAEGNHRTRCTIPDT